MINGDNLLKIGQFTKPHGIKGEISLLTDYDISGISGDPYIVCEMDGIFIPFFIDSYRQKSSVTTLVKFKNIDSEEKVKMLSGKIAYLPSDIILQMDDDETNWSNLIGYTVIDEKAGTIGQVIEIDDSTINILLIVDCKGDETLIPVALIATIDQASKNMKVSLPEGFLEIL